MKKLIALLLAVAMLLSFAACGEKPQEPTETTAPDATTVADEAVDATTAAEVEETTVAEETTVEETTVEETTAAIPTETKDIIEYYNATIAKAVDAKVGFNKLRYVDNEKLNAGFLLKTFGDIMYQFMGIGAENKYTMDVTKGQWESDLPHQYLRKSTLSEADVTKATCTADGDELTIVLSVKGGSSFANKNEKSNNSPIDKCGICVGDEDKSYYDHKTALVIYNAIDDVLGGADVSESYKNATVKAVIDSTTGNLVSLTVEYDIDIAIDVTGGGNATGNAHVFYKNFKY